MAESIAITLTAKATNGCYGVIVGRTTTALPSGVHGTITGDMRRDFPGVQMVWSTVTHE
jgi:hypothetical protein